MKRFKLSYSTIQNIIKEFGNKNYKGKKDLNKYASKLLQSKTIQKRVKEYVTSETNPFWIEDIIRYVANVQGIQLQYHQLRDYVRDELHLSYKKEVAGNEVWI